MQLSMTPRSAATCCAQRAYSIDVHARNAHDFKFRPLVFRRCRKDEMIGFEQGRKMASGIAGSRFVPLDAQGHVLLSTEPAMKVLGAELSAFLGTKEPARQLTPRQTEVLREIALGKTDKEVAKVLSLESQNR